MRRLVYNIFSFKLNILTLTIAMTLQPNEAVLSAVCMNYVCTAFADYFIYKASVNLFVNYYSLLDECRC